MRPCRLVLLLLAVSFVTAATCEFAHAHGGGLDSLGCHNDRNRGEYHCHRNELAGRTFASKAEAEKALAGGVPSGSNTPPHSRSPTTGTYTAAGSTPTAIAKTAGTKS